MNNAVIKGLAISILVAVVGYICFSLFFIGVVSESVAFAIGALISGAGVSMLASGSADTQEEEETTTLYVGNLPYRANETSVRELFAEYGSVHSVRLLKDRHTGKRRGFGFVEMSLKDAGNAINSLNDKDFMQRTIKVREAKNQSKEADDQSLAD